MNLTIPPLKLSVPVSFTTDFTVHVACAFRGLSVSCCTLGLLCFLLLSPHAVFASFCSPLRRFGPWEQLTAGLSQDWQLVKVKLNWTSYHTSLELLYIILYLGYRWLCVGTIRYFNSAAISSNTTVWRSLRILFMCSFIFQHCRPFYSTCG